VDGEVVWSWRPDAGVKLAEQFAGDGGKRAGDRLFDSHILEPQSSPVFDAAEGFEA
jgi:hypothetical protein